MSVNIVYKIIIIPELFEYYLRLFFHQYQDLLDLKSNIIDQYSLTYFKQ